MIFLDNPLIIFSLFTERWLLFDPSAHCFHSLNGRGVLSIRRGGWGWLRVFEEEGGESEGGRRLYLGELLSRRESVGPRWQQHMLLLSCHGFDIGASCFLALLQVTGNFALPRLVHVSLEPFLKSTQVITNHHSLFLYPFSSPRGLNPLLMVLCNQSADVVQAKFCNSHHLQLNPNFLEDTRM